MDPMRFGFYQTLAALRRGQSPLIVALWATVTAYGVWRRIRRPGRELLAVKRLQPGDEYVIRMHGREELRIRG